MTDETRILRTVGIPIVIAIVLLVAVPKMCVKAVLVSKARQEKTAHQNGLHIESTQKPVSYPSGLDADRIRYMVETDNGFSAPYNAHIAKAASTIGDLKILGVLQRLGYVERGSDGTMTLSRDGLLHLDGVVDDGASWTFPVAKRQFETVAGIEGDANAANATIAWKWQPNTVGASLIPDPKRHEAKGQFAHVATGWAMTGLTLDNDLD
ncbi:MAG: hypothetical protein JO093_21650 [Acidobacteria bacterium]|nr:hypothetical protein [Acidobacteriota bacterium]MBV9067620.1 hypothetical protein [Acidobacteriota bacterium]MBV9188228.1 hypothetical protein [Acidobacteriota bacterium]